MAPFNRAPSNMAPFNRAPSNMAPSKSGRAMRAASGPGPLAYTAGFDRTASTAPGSGTHS
jgi:hypothetical protein